MAVTNFTADAIGDYFFAKLQEPYSNVTRVLSWNILVGVNSPNSVGTLDVVSGSNQFVGSNVNLNLSPGNKFIVGGQVFTVHSIQGDTITSVETSDFTATGAKWYEYPDLDNYFTYEFRYSQEAAGTDGGQMSELRPLNNSIGPRDLLGIQFDSTIPLWFYV